MNKITVVIGSSLSAVGSSLIAIAAYNREHHGCENSNPAR
jgi:hypothetical protein